MPDYYKIAKKSGKILLWTAGSLALLLLLLSGIALIFWNFYLAEYVEKQADTILRESFGLNRTEFHVRRIGLGGLDLENFVLTGEDRKTLRIDSIRADYLPMRNGQLLDISSLTVAGGDIFVTQEEGKLRISGFDLDHVLNALQKPKTSGKANGPAVTLRQVKLHDIRLHLDLEGKRLVLPVSAEITSPGNTWKKISAKLSLSLRGQPINLDLAYDAETAALSVTGDAKLRLASLADLTGVTVGGTADLKFDASVGVSDGVVQLTGKVGAGLDLRKAGLPIEFTEPVTVTQNVILRYRTAEKELSAILEGNMAGAAFTFNQGTVEAEFSRPAYWKFILTRRPGEEIKLPQAEFKVEAGTLHAYGFQLELPLLRLEEEENRYILTAGGMRLTDPKRKIDADDIRLTIPLALDSGNPATLNFGRIRYDKQLLGEIRSTFHIADNMKLEGTFINRFLPGARVDFRGSVTPRIGQMPDMLFELNVPPWSPEKALDLGEFHPKLAGIDFSGVVSLGGAARVENGKLTTGVQLLLESGKVDWEEKKLHADNIRLNLRFTDLLKMTTPGNQSFRIGSLKAGNLAFENIRFNFDIASMEQLDFERIETEWCGGTLMLHSIKLNPMKLAALSVKSSLFCENLELAQIIQQLNLGNATGDGALFGKIPFSFSTQRGLVIDTSYLYSRPGTINTIRIADPEKLVGNLNEEVLRQTQLDFATEALRDFSYSWTKMNFDTEKESGDLLISLQFDGKPNQPLPFAYDDASGQLKREPSSRAVFQGIQLNINTRLPLQELLDLNELLK